MDTWMWLDGADLRAVIVRRETRTLEWYEAVGSTCGDDGSSARQAFAAFARHGPPPSAGHVPDDVLARLHAALARLDLQAPAPGE